MDSFEEFFNRYLQDLRGARDEALAWWDQLFESELARDGGDRDAARLRIDLRWPCGPASFPRVIAVFRRYYLECKALQTPEETAVEGAADDESAWGTEVDEDSDRWDEPRQLLIDHLINVDQVLGQFMKLFVFIPIGNDETS
jgi:hypothetical protein